MTLRFEANITNAHTSVNPQAPHTGPSRHVARCSFEVENVHFVIRGKIITGLFRRDFALHKRRLHGKASGQNVRFLRLIAPHSGYMPSQVRCLNIVQNFGPIL